MHLTLKGSFYNFVKILYILDEQRAGCDRGGWEPAPRGVHAQLQGLQPTQAAGQEPRQGGQGPQSTEGDPALLNIAIQK